MTGLKQVISGYPDPVVHVYTKKTYQYKCFEDAGWGSNPTKCLDGVISSRHVRNFRNGLYRFGDNNRNDIKFYIVSIIVVIVSFRFENDQNLVYIRLYIVSVIVSFRFKNDRNLALDRNFAHAWSALLGTERGYM